MNWLYKGKNLTEPVSNKYGFIYLITCLSGDYKGYIYVGSKTFLSTRNPKISKKRANELYSGKGRKPTREKKVMESDWKTYTTSSNLINELIGLYGEGIFKADILGFADSKADLQLMEIEYQIKYKVFRITESFNQMLKASIYKKNII